MPLIPADLDPVPRLGWIDALSPITSLPELADRLGLEFLGVKRDDSLAALGGGSKPRKLDYLLANPPFKDAKRWIATGGIGSGSLAALAAAAQKLERRLEAHVFWTPISAGILDNLALIASGPTTLTFHSSRVSLALSRPALVLARDVASVPIVPPGASSPLGMLGLVRAGLELAEQIREGSVPKPDRVYVALGSGGTAVGIAAGLSLGEVDVPVHAIAVVESPLSTTRRMRGLEQALVNELARHGLATPRLPLRIVIDRSQLGRGYAVPTPEALRATETLTSLGIPLEPVYTGKAVAALFSDAKKGTVKHALFWNTVRGPTTIDPSYREKLPKALRYRIAERKSRITKRRAFLFGSAAAVALGVLRVSGYRTIPGFHGKVLASWEAVVLHAVAEAVLGGTATAEALLQIPTRVDRYLATLEAGMRREVHELLALIEHGTMPLDGHLFRFTSLSLRERRIYLAKLEGRRGILGQAHRGLRDLCMIGYYQQPEAWAPIGYGGPQQALDYDPSGPSRLAFARYDALVAPQGAMPRGIVR